MNGARHGAMAQDPTLEPEEELAAAPPPVPPQESEGGLSALLAPQAPSRPARTGPTVERLPSAARDSQPSAHAAFLARKHFASLDGLRAIGILAVVWHHTMGGPGRFGANLFFLLSGFLVTTLLVRERAKKGTVDVTRFRTRRARRLYPLYFAVLASYVALVWQLEAPGPTRTEFFANLPAFATFTSNLFVGLDSERVIFYFAWSLAAQEQFYLLWPLFLKHLRLREAALALVSLLATTWLTRMGAFDGLLSQGTLLRTLVLSLMPTLLIGALLALTLNARAGFEAVQRWLGGRFTSCAFLGLALILWRVPSLPEVCIQATLALLAAACVVREDHALARLLRSRLAVHVGSVSFGIYLMHMLCHNVVARALARGGFSAGVLDFLLTAALAVGVATVSHRYFEDRFLPREKRRAAA
jgi:peptidoglycan/LPS O-acetylase OafA/YrhL